MADLPKRSEYEAKLSKEIAAILAQNRAEWQDGLDAPQTERSLREKLMGFLLLIFTLGAGTAAGELGFALVADGAARGWAGNYSGVVARFALTRVRKAMQTVKQIDPLNREGIVTAAIDKLIDPKVWGNFVATEITRANTAGGEYAATVYNIGRVLRQPPQPLIGQPITPEPLPGLVPADDQEQPPDEPLQLPEPALALWHTSRDQRVCPVCKPLHGRPREEWERVAPLGPPAHVACRCYVDYEVAGN